jgi:hypothetical protein
LPTLEALKFTLGTARNLILTLDQDDTLTGAASHESERWEPLMDQLAAALERDRPGSLASVLSALYRAVEA